MWERINDMLAQASNRIVTRIANFIPGLLALLLILVITIALAAIVRWSLRRFLHRVHFDGRVAQWGFPELVEWSPGSSPTTLLVRITSWIILIVGLLFGINALDEALPSFLATQLFAYIPHVLAALIVLAVGAYAARFLARGVLISAVNMKLQSARLLSLGVKWMVLVLAAAMALEHLGIGGPIVTLFFAILFGGIVLALALAVGLGSKDMVSRSWEQQSQSEKGPGENLQHL